MGAVLNPEQRQIAAKDFLFFAQFFMVADYRVASTNFWRNFAQPSLERLWSFLGHGDLEESV
jgi:hypothetical protein